MSVFINKHNKARAFCHKLAINSSDKHAGWLPIQIRFLLSIHSVDFRSASDLHAGEGRVAGDERHPEGFRPKSMQLMNE